MAQGRDSPTGYDWEGSAVPSEPEPLMLPEPADGTPHGAPSFTYDAQGPADESRRRRGALPAWAIVAIVVVQASALVATVGLVMGGLQRFGGEEPAPPAATAPTEEPAQNETPSEDRKPGTVTDSAGRKVTDGTGGYDDPATIGEHTVSWTTWTDGTLAVTAREVDLAATAPEPTARTSSRTATAWSWRPTRCTTTGPASSHPPRSCGSPANRTAPTSRTSARASSPTR
ncbi:hypothetical protein H3H54_15550 [Brachybacterium sp. Z12]|uniref:hypothetical protein n=1 Tax=Brachybacterium sp. Z12 TaxID=2759167 RepID=UPI001861FC82|nr:hypothetical protein [Brachybacterium sp. Z12]QNN82399.1 hypothetical protein H3H54_15550 [Brachybacterium sp. Z12]